MYDKVLIWRRAEITQRRSKEYVIDMNLICIWYSFNEIDVGWHLNLEKKQKIHRAAYFGTTHYVINMDLICDGYEFDMYLIQFQWNWCMIKSGLRENQNKQGLSCAKLRLASPLSLLLLLNPKLCKFEKQSTSTEVHKVK